MRTKVQPDKVVDFSPQELRRLPMRDLLKLSAEAPDKTYESLAVAAELKRREGWPARLALTISILSFLIGTGISVESLRFASRQFRLASEMPYKAALYSAKVQAMRDYARAYHQYDTQLHEALIDLPYLVDTKAELDLITDEGMGRTAMIARPVISEHSAYVREVAASLGVWPDYIENQMLGTSEAAQAAGACFATLGAHAQLTHALWQGVRDQAANTCADINDHRTIEAFELGSEQTLKAMRSDLAHTDNELLPKED